MVSFREQIFPKREGIFEENKQHLRNFNVDRSKYQANYKATEKKSLYDSHKFFALIDILLEAAEFECGSY